MLDEESKVPAGKFRDWSDMTKRHVSAAGELGWNQASWTEGGTDECTGAGGDNGIVHANN